MKEKGEKGAIVREDDRMTHRGQKCVGVFFCVCLPVCAVYMCAYCVYALRLFLLLCHSCLSGD